MTDVVKIALIVAVAPTLTSLAGFFATLRHNLKVDHYKHEVNSRMDELLRVSGESQRAQGRMEGIAQERIRERGPQS